MRRWNGWGDDSVSHPLPPEGRRFLHERIGQAKPLADATLESVCQRVPPSRLPADPDMKDLIDRSAEARVRHARGQSLPDWLAMRSGQMEPFPDGVAQPHNSDQVATLLAWARQHGVRLIPYGGGTSVVGHINPPDSDQPVLDSIPQPDEPPAGSG